MSALKDQLKADMVAAMKARDDLARSTLRMAISAIQNEEVAGKVARELDDTEVLAVLKKEVARRKDAAEAYLAGSRPELAAKESAEAEFLQRYLPAALSEAEVDQIVAAVISRLAAETGSELTMKQMGLVMKSVTAEIAGRADGKLVAGKVRSALA